MLDLAQLRGERMNPIEYAVVEYKPIKLIALYSGGDDSVVSTHFAMTHGAHEVAFIDTGIGVDESPEMSAREHVIRVCKQFGWPLRVWNPPDRTYRDMVMIDGFPGPGAHLYPYVWLKDRAIAQMLREAKVGKSRRATVGLITGVRNTESARRMGFVKPVVKVGGRIWIAAVHGFNKIECLEYIKKHKLPRSPISQLIGMSGECFCGAFAEPSELERKIRPHFPKLAAKIDELQAAAEQGGIRDCIWGVRPRKNRKNYDLPFMPMCVNCQGGNQKWIHAGKDSTDVRH